MRLIKFRAWHKAEQKMYPVYGTFLNAVCLSSPLYGAQDVLTYVTIDEVELMQFTGLTDRHGAPVYEGDIVKGTTNEFGVRKERIAQVEYDEDMLLTPFHDIWDYDGNLWMHCVVGGFEVIGTIYEHPHLLT